MAKFIFLLTLVLQSVVGLCAATTPAQMEAMAMQQAQSLRSQFSFAEVNAELGKHDPFELRKQLEGMCREQMREFLVTARKSQNKSNDEILSQKMHILVDWDQNGNKAKMNFTAKVTRCESGCGQNICKAYPVVEKLGDFKAERLSDSEQ